MTIVQAIETIKHYNEWRRGGDMDQPSAIMIGIAIDTVIKFYSVTQN